MLGRVLTDLPPGTPLYGALTVLAMVCALFAKGERGPLVASSLLMAVNWLAFVLSFTELAPVRVFWHFDLMLESEHAWMAADCMCAGLALGMGFADRRGWGWALWALYTFQCFWHVCYDTGGVEYARYQWFLDKAYLGQIAVFVLIGGRGVCDWLLSCVPVLRLRRMGQPSRSSRAP